MSPFISLTLNGFRNAGRLAAVAALGCGLAACADSAPPGPLKFAGDGPEAVKAAMGEDGYRLGSGDRVRITVFGQPELSKEYQVDASGGLSFPLTGRIEAGGLSARGLEEMLVDKLDPDYVMDASVSVEVLTYRPFYIVGEVRQPGGYPFVSGMTVLNAVALSGGYTYRARENGFYVRRPSVDGRTDYLVATADTPILPGDIITVRERYF